MPIERLVPSVVERETASTERDDDMPSRSGSAVAAIGIAFALAMAGCTAASGSPGDKAGGSTSTVTLTMGVTDPKGRTTTPTVEFFVNQVAEQSKGSIRLEVSWNAGEGTGDGGDSPLREGSRPALSTSAGSDLGRGIPRASPACRPCRRHSSSPTTSC